MITNGDFKQDTSTELTARESEELKAEELKTNVACSVAPVIQPLIEYDRFSNFNRLLRVTVMVLRFVHKLKLRKHLIQQTVADEQVSLGQARMLILQDIQNKSHLT